MLSLDLFAGAGGITQGFKQAGIRSIGAIEIDHFACQTFSSNFPEVPLYGRDIRGFTKKEIEHLFCEADIISAGPPCQGFSVAGPSQYSIIDSPRNNLILEIPRFAAIIRPKICIIENVKGILSGKLSPETKATAILKEEFENIGYSLTVQIVQAADFGVPQNRERVVMVAVQDKAKVPKIKGNFGSKRKPWRTVKDAIGDLPLVVNGGGVEEKVPYDKPALTQYQRLMRINSDGVCNYVSMQHSKRLLERFVLILPGKSLKDAPPHVGQRLRNGTEIDAKPRFKINNQRLCLEKPSIAIWASFQSNFIHPILNRNLTAREGCRIQSFPDRFVFKGPRTLMSKKLLLREGRLDEIGLSQYNQIGNAVPPLLAEGIGRAILNVWSQSE